MKGYLFASVEDVGPLYAPCVVVFDGLTSLSAAERPPSVGVVPLALVLTSVPSVAARDHSCIALMSL